MCAGCINSVATSHGEPPTGKVIGLLYDMWAYDSTLKYPETEANADLRFLAKNLEFIGNDGDDAKVLEWLRKVEAVLLWDAEVDDDYWLGRVSVSGGTELTGSRTGRIFPRE